MIQDQLVDYISSQRALGVSRDAIKAALVGAGWVPADVEDTFRKVEGPAVAAPSAAQPAMPTSSFPSSSSPVGNSPFAAKNIVKSAEPQMVRVSDLVSASAPASSASPLVGSSITSPVSAVRPAAKMNPSPTAAQTKDMMGVMGAGKKAGRGVMLATVAIVLIVILAGLSTYLFIQNGNLSKSVSGVNAQSQSVTSQIATLDTQVQELTASGTTLAAQVSSLTATNQNLSTDLSFFVVPTGVAGAPVNPAPITVSGVLSGGKPIYTLLTADGIKAYVKNSSDAGVRAALDPLVGGSTTVQIVGTYIPGSPNITVTTVNGVSTTPMQSASSSASTTTP